MQRIYFDRRVTHVYVLDSHRRGYTHLPLCSNQQCNAEFAGIFRGIKIL